MSTNKIYLQDFNATTCSTTVKEINENGIILGDTVAFAEGGGQIGDSGIIISNDGIEIKFNNAKKSGGTMLEVDNLPRVAINFDVLHITEDDNLKNIKVGDQVTVSIDRDRRNKITCNHSAIHLVYMFLEELREGITTTIKGCKINETYGRLDFAVEDRITAEDLTYISNRIKEVISNKAVMKINRIGELEDVFIWECLGVEIPCGGTHLNSCDQINQEFKLKRKGIGKNLERIIIESTPILSVE